MPSGGSAGKGHPAGARIRRDGGYACDFGCGCRQDACVIEDAACALVPASRPASWSVGYAGCFSFHPRKVITTGEGGAVTTSRPELARRLRTLRNHGLDPLSSTPEFVTPGFNYRLTEFQAAMGVVQMKRLSELIGHRRRAAEEYDRLLEGTGITTPLALEPAAHIYQAYVVLLSRAAADRQPQSYPGFAADQSRSESVPTTYP